MAFWLGHPAAAGSGFMSAGEGLPGSPAQGGAQRAQGFRYAPQAKPPSWWWATARSAAPINRGSAAPARRHDVPGTRRDTALRHPARILGQAASP